MKRLLSALLLLSLTDCVSPTSLEEPRQPLPSASEVIAHVREHWSDDYSDRFASFASRRGETAELLAVDAVKCDYYYGTPDCTFRVTARFNREPEQKIELSSSFDRDDHGSLKAVFIMVHQRPS